MAQVFCFCPYCAGKNLQEVVVCRVCGKTLSSINISAPEESAPPPSIQTPPPRLEPPVPAEPMRPNWSTPLVDRDPQKEFLAKIGDAVRGGKGQVLLLSGEPGVGKTRLLLETRVEPLGDFIHWGVVCPEHGQYISFGVFRDLLRKVCGVSPEDPLETGREKLNCYLERIAYVDGTMSSKALLSVMGYWVFQDDPTTPLQRRRETIRSLIEFLNVSSRVGQICLVLDDIHHIDPSSEETVLELINSMEDFPLLLCLVAREEKQALWRLENAYVSSLVLHPLSPEEADRLARFLLESELLPDGFQRFLSAKNGRIPLVIEEVVRQLITEEMLKQDKTVWSIDWPLGKETSATGLLDIVHGRVSRLGQSIRDILEVGAVIGRSFAVRLLEFMEETSQGLRDKIASLESMGFLEQVDEQDGLHLVFHHVVTQEVVYNSLLQRHKQALHGRVLQALFSIYGDDSESHYEMIAYHAVKANLPVIAVKYLERCARRARSHCANQEALQFYGQMLSLLANSPRLAGDGSKIAEILLKQEEIHRLTGELDEARLDIDQALRVAEGLGQKDLVVRAQLSKALLALSEADWETTEQELDQVRSFLSSSEDVKCSIRLSNIEGIAYWRRGRLSEAQRCFERVISQGNGSDPKYISNAYNNLGLISVNLGQPEEALKSHLQALEIREAYSDFWGQAASHNNIGIVFENMGDFESAEKHYQKALRLAQATEFREAETAVLCNLGELAEIRERSYDAMEFNARSLRLARKNRDPRSEAIALDNLGNLYQASGARDEAFRNHGDSLEIANRIGDSEIASRALLGLSLDHLDQEQMQQSEFCWEEARKLIEETGLKESVPRLHRVLAKRLYTQGDLSGARSEALTALGNARSLRQPKEEKQIARLLDTIGQGLGSGTYTGVDIGDSQRGHGANEQPPGQK